MGGFMATHYLMPLISGTQVVVGALLLANCFVPLALALIAPVVVNIVCYHVFFFRQGLEIAIVVGLLEVFSLTLIAKLMRPCWPCASRQTDSFPGPLISTLNLPKPCLKSSCSPFSPLWSSS